MTPQKTTKPLPDARSLNRQQTRPRLEAYMNSTSTKNNPSTSALELLIHAAVIWRASLGNETRSQRSSKTKCFPIRTKKNTKPNPQTDTGQERPQEKNIKSVHRFVQANLLRLFSTEKPDSQPIQNQSSRRGKQKKQRNRKRTRHSSNSPAMAVFLLMELDVRREGYSSKERGRDKACESAEREEAVLRYLLLPRLIRRLVCLHPAVADITQMLTGTIQWILEVFTGSRFLIQRFHGIHGIWMCLYSHLSFCFWVAFLYPAVPLWFPSR